MVCPTTDFDFLVGILVPLSQDADFYTSDDPSAKECRTRLGLGEPFYVRLRMAVSTLVNNTASDVSDVSENANRSKAALAGSLSHILRTLNKAVDKDILLREEAKVVPESSCVC